MTVLCFTGWQQPVDALSIIAPQDAIHAPYADYNDTAALFASLPTQVNLAIGWSLGGQTLVRAVANGHIKAQHIILLGAPFQFLASDTIAEGMPHDQWAGVVEGYRSNPHAMLKEFSGIISAGDSHAASITRSLITSIDLWKNGLFWLEELGRFSCSSLDFSGFPPTTIIHGDSDKVIYPAQAQLFKTQIPHATVLSWKNCAHAPHLHDPAALKQLVIQHV